MKPKRASHQAEMIMRQNGAGRHVCILSVNIRQDRPEAGRETEMARAGRLANLRGAPGAGLLAPSPERLILDVSEFP